MKHIIYSNNLIINIYNNIYNISIIIFYIFLYLIILIINNSKIVNTNINNK